MRGVKPNGRKYSGWGDVMLHYLGKGFDHGAAMFMADEWGRRNSPTTNDDEGHAARRASAEGAENKNLQERNIE